MIQSVRLPCDEASIQHSHAAGGCPRDTEKWVLAATILGSTMAFVDGSVVNVALPVLQIDLRTTVSDLQWVVEAYTLFLAALTLVGGALGDRYGRRAVFTIGVVVFALASAVCGLAPGASQLIIARAVQGIGAALLVPGSLAIIGASFGNDRRGRAIGTWSGLTAISTAVGPVLGGWLVEHVSWRAVFFINLPLAIAVVIIAVWRVPESRAGSNQGRLDWPGALAVTLGLGTLVFGLIQAGALGLSHPIVLAALAVGVISMCAFLVVEARSRSPMMPLDPFQSRVFDGANLLTLMLYAALGGAFFFVPLNLIQVQGYSPTAAGSAFLPFIVIMSVLGRWSGGLVDRYGARLPLVVGPTIAAAGFALLALPGIGGSYWTTFFPAMVTLGLGMAITVAPLTTTVMNAVDEDHVGVASGINNSVARVAGLLAVAVFGIVVLVTFDGSLDQRLASLHLPPRTQVAVDAQRTRLASIQVPTDISPGTQFRIKRAVAAAYVDGYRLAMLVAAGLALVSAGSAELLIGGRRAKTPAR